MKIFFTCLIFFVFSLTACQAFSNPLPNRVSIENPGKNNSMNVGSNRKSGDMQLHFTAEKAGEEAIITIVNDSGKIVLRQTNLVNNSDNIIPLKNATGLNDGAYTVQLVSNGQTCTVKFMIWK